MACPGRLLDHLRQGTINLGHVEVLVLDEADRMFDMGFLPDVRRIVRAVPEQRQTLLFAATMPDDIRSLVREVLRDPLTVQIGRAAPVETVSHAVYPVPQHLKTSLLAALLRGTEAGSVLVFTRTKHRAKKVAQQLARAPASVLRSCRVTSRKTGARPRWTASARASIGSWWRRISRPAALTS